MHQKSDGFTLIELVVVLGIFGLVMLASYTILETTIEADRRVHEATLTGKVGEAILNQMRRDLQGTIWRGFGEEIFRGESRGEEENAEDTIDFWVGEAEQNGEAKSDYDNLLSIFKALQIDYYNLEKRLMETES
mgnify:CR=1 FL=1